MSGTALAAGPVSGTALAAGPVSGTALAAGPVSGTALAAGPVSGTALAAGPSVAYQPAVRASPLSLTDRNLRDQRPAVFGSMPVCTRNSIVRCFVSLRSLSIYR